MFRESDGISGETTKIKVTAHDMRERFTSTATLLGTAHTTFSDLRQKGRLRLRLDSPNPEGRSAGFVTLTRWAHVSKHSRNFAQKNKVKQNLGLSRVQVILGRGRVITRWRVGVGRG